MVKKKSSSSDLGVSGGKGDVPRSCFSKQFRDNYDAINWGRWTKANDDALHTFCDEIETFGSCNTSSPKTS